MGRMETHRECDVQFLKGTLEPPQSAFPPLGKPEVKWSKERHPVPKSVLQKHQSSHRKEGRYLYLCPPHALQALDVPPQGRIG